MSTYQREHKHANPRDMGYQEKIKIITKTYSIFFMRLLFVLLYI